MVTDMDTTKDKIKNLNHSKSDPHLPPKASLVYFSNIPLVSNQPVKKQPILSDQFIFP